MKAELLARWRELAVAFDCETHKIQPGLLVPPLVCASVAWWDPSQGRSVGKLLDKEGALEWFLKLLDGEYIIVGANIAFDMAVMARYAAEHHGLDLMPKILRAYEQGRVYDIQIAEALHAVAIGMLGKNPKTGNSLRDPVTNKLGRYSLSIVLWLVLDRRDAKVNDRFRQSYALLEDTPQSEWPLEARTYPVDDACNTWDCGAGQVGAIPRPIEHDFVDQGGQYVCTHCAQVLSFADGPPCPPRAWPSYNLHDVARQVYAALAMHLGAIWGFKVDPEAVDALELKVRASREVSITELVRLGFLRWAKAKGVKFETPVAIAELSAEDALALFRADQLKLTRNTGAIKRTAALAYECRGACPTCAGTGKVPSAKSQKPVGCRMCDSTGLNLDSAPVPRTKGSKCRTCRGGRSYSTASKKNPNGNVVPCLQCTDQPDIVPGCATGRDALYESGHDDLISFASYSEQNKIIETYLPFLKRGIADVPDDEEDEDTETEGETE